MSKSERKKRELKVEIQVTYVPLPDQAATDRWRAGLGLLLKLLLDRSIEQEQIAGNPSPDGEYETVRLLS